MATNYNDPVDVLGAGAVASTVGPQLNTQYYHKKALIDAAKETYFGQLADVTAMPKHFGKTIKIYQYFPILDDRNLNDQGLDAAGAILTVGQWTAFDVNGDIIGSTYANEGAALAAGGAVSAQTNSGNLHGSSKDIGKINGKLPLVGETGGRVNRVGQTRVTIEADITKLGFFTEYSKDALQFDTDEELYEHISREMILAANEITEDVLQMDLLNGASTNRYGGIASSRATITGESADTSLVTYADLQTLAIDLDNNRTPKKTNVITGSRMVDTRVVASGRYMYHGSEMVPTFSKMKDYHNAAAYVGVEHYAYSSVTGVNAINGEHGKIGAFRLIQVPEMEFWEGGGGAVTSNAGYRETGGKYDVYPLLVVGDGAFTTIGFQTDGKSTKFKIKHRMPESEGAYTKEDPFGELGFTSIKWWYGTLVMRPERLGVFHTVAEQ